MPTRDIYDSLCVLDYRYYDDDVAPYLSENAFTKYKLKVEMALVRVLHRYNICSWDVVSEIEKACALVTTEEVYIEEERIRHDIRALVNCIQRKVSNAAKPYVHMTATSFDIIDTANAARYRDVMFEVVIPVLKQLLEVLTRLALREADTLQVGRTHGQHAVPITFGFAIAEYVSRIGQSIQNLERLADELVGKFSGAVGSYNSLSLFVDDPEEFEMAVMGNMNLLPAEYSTQIAPLEPLARLLSEITIVATALANLADDMRHLQRTEIGEVGEAFEDAQVASSTMPQKRNPINFENAKSIWKSLMPRIITVYLDLISEHQRDLTNSASGRTYGESFCYIVSIAKRLTRTMDKMSVDIDNLNKNLAMQHGLILAEPLYLILASLGHPNAHEKVRKLTLKAQKDEKSLQEIVAEDEEITRDYIGKMSERQLAILSDPSKYIGIAPEKAKRIANDWRRNLGF